jgi:flagellar hook-associated protein 2
LAIQSTSNSGSQIDVASIVSQLMQVEQKPLTALQNKIAKNDVKISSLGSFQGQLSAFQTALKALQDTSNFAKKTISNSTPASAKVAITSAASPDPGRYKLSVTQTAEAGLVNVSGFASDTDLLANATSFTLRVGGVDYSPSASDNVTTVAGFRDWINSHSALKDKVKATLLQTDAAHWSLALQGLRTGTDNALSVTTPSVAYTATAVQEARNASFSVNGIEFSRASNTITDAIPGLTLNLWASSTNTVIEVTGDTSTTRPLVDAFVSSYNDLLSSYKSLTQSNANADLRGVLNSDSTLTSIMRQISSGLSHPQNGLDKLGLEFAKDGRLAVNETLYNSLSNLPQTLASGFRLGLSGSLDLSNTIDGFLSDSGTLASRIQSEKDNQTDLNRRKTQLESKLALLQSRYTAQYAALDALLFKLNNTSTALKSALDALTNSQKNN